MGFNTFDLGRSLRKQRKLVKSSYPSGGVSNSSLSILFNRKYIPSRGDAQPIRVIPGKHKGPDGKERAFHMYCSHSVKLGDKFRTFQCSRKPYVDKKRSDEEGVLIIGWTGDCVGCYAIEEKRMRHVGMRVMHAFTVVALNDYHKVEVYDKQTKGTRTDKNGDPLYNLIPCEGRPCKYCKKNKEKVRGMKGHWALGSGHLEHLSGIVEEIGKDCKNCNTRQSITIDGYACQNCDAILLDLYNTELEQEEVLAAIDSDSIECGSCKNVGPLEPVVECKNCQDPQPLSLFDVNIWIKRQGEGTNSTIQSSLWKFEEIEQDLIDELESRGDTLEPYALEQVYSGTPHDRVARLLNIENPFQGQGNHREWSDSAKTENKADYGN